MSTASFSNWLGAIVTGIVSKKMYGRMLGAKGETDNTIRDDGEGSDNGKKVRRDDDNNTRRLKVRITRHEKPEILRLERLAAVKTKFQRVRQCEATCGPQFPKFVAS